MGSTSNQVYGPFIWKKMNQMFSLVTLINLNILLMLVSLGTFQIDVHRVKRFESKSSNIAKVFAFTKHLFNRKLFCPQLQTEGVDFLRTHGCVAIV